MPPASAEDRALAVLAALSLHPASKAASGRYLRSLPVRPGVRYWAASRPRSAEDYFGVQFYGEGSGEAASHTEPLLAAGFRPRNPQTGQITFAKPVAFSPGGDIDSRALQRVRRELDAILDQSEPDAARSASSAKTQTFREFMLGSPLADVDLDLPARTPAWRPSSV